MPQRVYITGIGMISSIGNDTGAALTSLIEEKSGIGEITLLDTVLKDKYPLAEVKLSNEELLEIIGNSGKTNFTRTALLGMVAAREALNASGIEIPGKYKTGLISATTVGGMDRSENFYKEFLADPSKGHLIDIVNHDCADSTERIADFLGITGFMTTISTACSSSANSIMLGAQLIKAGFLDRVVAGGTDSVTKFTLNGFNTLMILDKNGCRPFDENRAGLTLGEGAAYVVLESEELVKAGNKKVLAELKGYGNANDAYHQTASSPEGTGAYLAMNSALQLSGLNPGDIDYINVHGTGTQNNDLSEGVALQKIFGEKPPPFSSTKSYTGHTLGAAGALEAVISVLSINHGMLFPNLRFETPMKELGITPFTKVIMRADVQNILSNSFGFGGNNSTLIFSKMNG
ncbi:MAG: beta-ketoacyl-[acyl-carrier-protein] synthase family protein [Bacteroidetes bacterium]|nr:beta-ketoacyl-[acyl-carrier-protein] synthase family protein [Bacteroidota bacterium]